jgi:hypothetical protein
MFVVRGMLAASMCMIGMTAGVTHPSNDPLVVQA